MIVEHNLKINNRKRLNLALNVAREKRDTHLKLFKHNTGVVQEKWSISRLAYAMIQESGPAALGGMLASASTMFTQKQNDEDEEHPFMSTLKSFLVKFGRKVLQKME